MGGFCSERRKDVAERAQALIDAARLLGHTDRLHKAALTGHITLEKDGQGLWPTKKIQAQIGTC